MTDRLPLFPLNTVLFPGVVMPLYVFEDRYRSLVNDLISLPPDADREFGVVAITIGYEVGDTGVQTIQRVGCAALVTDITANPDGSFELLVVGRRRFHVRHLDRSQDYLNADVEWLADRGGPVNAELAATAARAGRLFDRYRAEVRDLRGDDVLDGDTPDDPVDLSYTLAASLIVPLADRQRLLESPDLGNRLQLGIAMLRSELQAIRVLPALPATSLARTGWCPN